MGQIHTIITGNVVADPELKISDKGVAVCAFRVATSERKKDEAGNWVDGETTYLSCKAFGAIGEAVAESVRKGAPVVVVGRLTSRTVEKDGNKTTYFNVLVESCALDVKQALRKSGASGSMGKPKQPILADIDPVIMEVANYIKEAKQQKDMAGFIAIAQLIVERVRNA